MIKIKFNFGLLQWDKFNITGANEDQIYGRKYESPGLNIVLPIMKHFRE